MDVRTTKYPSLGWKLFNSEGEEEERCISMIERKKD